MQNQDRCEALLAQLNPLQRKAVERTEGPLLVVAGAGSGKTRVITYRIAYLVDLLGVRPSSILAVTFTNKAAGEMRNRIEAMGCRGVEAAWIGTFHAICARILRRNIEAIGYTSNFVIYDDIDQLDMIRTVLKDLEISEEIMDPRQVRHAIEQEKNAARGPDAMEAGDDGFRMRRIAEVYRVYQERLKEQNALDFGDLIMLTVALFDGHPDLLDRYTGRFRYIHVDEYQDTNRAQYLFVRQLASGHGNLCVVGDEDQSIYRWRGADMSNILNFERDFPGAELVILDQNYRSTGNIIAAASSVIDHNDVRKAKKLWTEKPAGESITIHEARDEHDEARFVVTAIERERLSAARTLNEMAVFYRMNTQSRVIEDELRSAGIPYTVVGGMRFYDRKEIKDTIAYLRFLVNPADLVSLRRIINTPPRGIGTVTVAAIEGHASSTGKPVYDALEEVAGGDVLAARATRHVSDFVRLVATLREAATRDPLDEFVELLVEENRMVSTLERAGTIEAGNRLENLAELITAAKEFTETMGDAPPSEVLSAFLEQVALVSNIDEYDEAPDRVSLLTLHSAKGLEYPVVFMVGMEEGLLPHAQSLDDPAEFEEERRLCYVGMTRAQERLFMTRASSRALFGRFFENPPSGFLDEVPEEKVEASSWRSRYHVPKAAWSGAGFDGPDEVEYVEETEAMEEDGEPGIGDRVMHATFGRGVLLGRQGDGPKEMLFVNFDGVGMKRLLARYANITKVGKKR